jgi:hypothetical protein
MAAKTPVVVSDTGGLSEIVEHDKTGVKVYPNNSDSLAWGINRLLLDRRLANALRENAYKEVVAEYGWNKIADETIEVYRQAMMMAPPRIRAKSLVSFPYFSLEAYPAEFKILILLHVLGAVDRDHARSARDMAKMLKMKVDEILLELQKLLNSGYAETYKDQLRGLLYYLTEKGIIKACSLFS